MNQQSNLLNAGLTVSIDNGTYMKLFLTLVGSAFAIIVIYNLFKK